MKNIRLLLMVTALLLCIVSVQATTVVLMEFDGDPGFPTITWQINTAGLGAFTGSAFGLAPADRDAVVAKILEFVREDYAPYDVEFITDGTLPHDFTWGIDDTAYVFTNEAPYYDPLDPYSPCPGGSTCSRLYGKAGTSAPDATDQYGTSIYHPTFARTWSGSFALGPGTASPSSPSLYGHSVDEISQALGNGAAHEIAHLFGVSHPPSNPGGNWNLMWVQVEGIEATNNKYFSNSDQAILLSFLGPRSTEECEEGATRCSEDVQYLLEVCENNRWVQQEVNSPECGYGPSVPEFPSILVSIVALTGLLFVITMRQRM